MKYTLTIFLLLSVITSAAQPKYPWTMNPGEYTAGYLDIAGLPWTITTDPSIAGTNNKGTQGIPTRLATIPSNKVMAGVGSSLHDGSFWSADSGRVFMYGLNGSCQLGNGTSTGTTSVVEILTDVNGNQFYGVTEVSGGWGPVSSVPFYAALESDTCTGAWFWGNLTNVNGGSTCAKPTFIPFPAGKHGHHIIAYNSSTHATMTDGSVYVIGGTDDNAANTGVNSTPTTWTHLTGMNAIAYVAKGNGWGIAVTTTGDSAYGWGQLGYVPKGLSSPVFTVITAPTLLNANISACLPVDTIVGAHTAWMAKKKDGTLWGAGSNEVGLLGIGPTINWNIYTVSPSPTGGTPQFWNWDTGMGEFVTGLTQIAKGKSNFMTVFGGGLYSFYFIAEDSTGHLFTAGRNKAAGLLTGVIPADTAGTRIAAAWHVSWNLNTLTSIFPDSLTSHANQIVANNPGYEWGLFTGTPGSFGTDAPNRPNTNLHANLVLTPTVNGFGWNGAPSTTDASHKIMFPYCTISQASGTSINLGVMGGKNGTIFCPPGTYGITYTVIDNSWDTVTTTVSITVPSSTQTGFYFSANGISTTCTAPGTSTSCPPSQISVIFPTLVAGDTAYFNKGDVFSVDIVESASGISGNPIVLASYGSGAEPVIGGMTPLAGWTNSSGNIWQAAWATPVPKLLTINNVLAGKSTTPNRTTGYFTFIPASSSTTDLHFTSNPFSLHDSVIVKSSGFTLDLAVVSTSTSTDATITPAVTFNNVGGNGAFRIGDTPDSATEWNLKSGFVQAFSVGSPSGYAVPAVGIPLTITGNYVNVTGLHFKGADTTDILISGDNCTITGDSIEDAVDGIQISSAVADTITGNYMAHFGNNAINKLNNLNYNLFIENNLVSDAGMITGMGTTGEVTQNYCGIIAGDSGATVKFNTIINTGYCAIAIYGGKFKADSNLINGFCNTKIDGAGIYTWVSSATTFAQREIIGNVVLNGAVGANPFKGTSLNNSSAASVAYIDNFSSQATVSLNTGHHINGPAFFTHYGTGNSFTFNSSDSSGYCDFLAAEVGPVISGLAVNNNNFLSGAPNLPAVRVTTINNDLSTFGTLDHNNIIGTIALTTPYWTFSTGASDPGTFRTPAAWTSITGNDAHSVYQTGRETLFYNFANVSNNLYLWTTFQDLMGSLHKPYSLTVPAYGSTPLLIWRPGVHIGSKYGGKFYN